MEKQTQLLKDLGKNLGIDLVFDENDQCFLLLDEQLMVSIKSADDHFILYGMLGEFPEGDISTAFCQKLLAFNFALAETGDGSIAIDESSEVVMLIKHLPIDGLDVTQFEKIVGHFASQLERLINILTEEEGLTAIDHSALLMHERA